MNRRDTLLGLFALATASLASQAQSAKKPARIAYLGFGTPEGNIYLVNAIKQRMRELGYIDGQDVVFDVRWAMLKPDRVPVLAKELVALGPDAIAAMNARVAIAMKQATSTIPIVMGSISDPVGMGLVQSLARPGGNVTGTSTLVADLSPKLLEFLLTVTPKLSRLAILYGPDSGAAQKQNLQAAALAKGLTAVTIEVGTPAEIESAFARMAREEIDAFVGLASGVLLTHRRQIAELATRHRLPSAFTARENVEAGALLSYGPSLIVAAQDSARYIDKILKGAKPADLPVEQPSSFELLINQKTARQIGLAIPQSFLIRADRVIE